MVQQRLSHCYIYVKTIVPNSLHLFHLHLQLIISNLNSHIISHIHVWFSLNTTNQILSFRFFFSLKFTKINESITYLRNVNSVSFSCKFFMMSIASGRDFSLPFYHFIKSILILIFFSLSR